MRCPSCAFENAEGMKFCVRCATPLSPRCAQCDFENPPGSLFCGQCATPLAVEVRSPESEVELKNDLLKRRAKRSAVS